MRTQHLLDRLTDELTRNCGDLLAAARTCGVSLQFVRQWCKDDPTTAEALREAELVGTQGLVSAAIKRAVHGVEEDVYYKGEVCGTKTNYSDTLLTTLLKAKIDDFKANNENAPQVTVNIANIMPRANSYEEWLAMRDATVVNQAQAKLTDMSNFAKSVMAPPSEDILDATFTVSTPAFAGIEL